MIVRKIKKNNLTEELSLVGVDQGAFEHFFKKSEAIIIKIYDIDSRGANILKQEFLSAGGDVAVHRDVASFKKERTDCIIIGNAKAYKLVIEKLKKEPYFGLSKVREKLEEITKENNLPVYKIRNYEFDFNRNFYLMAVLNITPDSFSDGGKYINTESAVKRAKEMIDEGADIIDIGGESTRPGAQSVDEEEELRRVIPVISRIREFSDIPISVDTYKSKVARDAIMSGADIVNDISGLKFDDKMISVVKEFDVPVVVMHIKGTPKDMQKNPQYSDLMREILEYFEERMKTLRESGIEKVIIDPGIGFGKRYEDNLKILNNLNEFTVFGLPVLVGSSRKSFIGTALSGRDVSDRLYGSLAASAIALLNGASVLRVHDVKPHKDLIKVIRAILNG